MRLSLMALAGLAFAGSALSQGPGGDVAARIQREAESHLRSCDGLSGDDARWCELNRRNFVTAYRRAHAGDYHAQRNVAFMLRGSTPGVAGNHVDSCAWRLIITAQGHRQADSSDTANIRFDCGRINGQQQAEARARALTLVQHIAADPARR